MAQDNATFQVEIVGLDKLIKVFERAPNTIEHIMQEAVAKSAALLAQATDSTTVPFKTGNLIRSFNPADIGRLFARWYPRTVYARALQFGYPPRNLKPRRYMENILAKATPKINELFKNALSVAVDRLAKQ